MKQHNSIQKQTKISEQAYKKEVWKIKQITVDPESLSMAMVSSLASGDVYEYDIKTNSPCGWGWGWLSTLSIIPIIIGILLLINHTIKEQYAAYIIFFGFFLIPFGLWLNYLCYKKGLVVIRSKILDTQFKYVETYNQGRSTGWGIRILVEFELNGKTYQSTPEHKGYIFIKDYNKAAKMYKNIKIQKSIRLNVHPKTPWTNTIYDLNLYA